MYRSALEFWRGKDNVPKNIHHLIHDPMNWNINGELKPYWKTVTWQDIFKKRKEDQEFNIRRKRRSEKLIRKPCFIWVLHNDNDWFFDGYWLYIKTLKKDYDINFRNHQKEIQKQVMELFHCGVLPCIDDFDFWAESFIKTFPHKGFKRKAKYQGLKRCWCEIDYYGRLVNILK